MALTQNSRGRGWSRLHALVRFLGLTGLAAVAAGMALALAGNPPDSAAAAGSALRQAGAGAAGGLAQGLLLGGGLLALLALAVEVIAGLGQLAGRRSAFGTNALVQVALAALALVAVNVYAFRHFRRFDWTRDGQFTLPQPVQQQLAELKSDTTTTIVVYQRHKTFGSLSDKPDRYDYAAERKVVEQVRDLVDQFRELGPRFRVVALDVEQEDFDQELASLPEELRQAIDRAPENSIFFQSGNRVQRLSFNDFYQLDKTASQEANGGKGNLVLRYQGVEPFARKVLNIEEKKPVVAFAVAHELLTSDGAAEEFTLAGAKKALKERGFEVRDLILKKWSRGRPPEAAVYTFDESKYERLADRLEILAAQQKFYEKQLDLWKTMPAEELEKRRFDERLRAQQIREWSSLVEQVAEQKKLASEDQGRLQVESLAEQRRLTDVKAKLDRALADVDLLILPRMTLRNVTLPPFNVPNEVHRLDEGQVAAIKDFLKAGKPVLAALGPTNESPDERPPPMGGPDGVEELLGQLGVKLSKQTVLFNREIGSLAEFQAALQGRRDLDMMSRGDDSDVPPLVLEPEGAPAEPPNPIRESLRLTAQSLGKGQSLDLRLRHPRPVTFEPKADEKPRAEVAFLRTDPDSWAEDQPFPTEKTLPRYEEGKKRGPATVGVAVEVQPPAEWYGKDDRKPEAVRLAVIGHGSAFVGPTLPPAKEKLLLDTSNWLLGRDDQLVKQGEPRAYPRVALTEREQTLWNWGAILGLPLLFAYLGLVVMLFRRLR